MARSVPTLLCLLLLCTTSFALNFQGNATFLDEATLIAPISFHNTLIIFNRTQISYQIDQIFASVAVAKDSAFEYIDKVYKENQREQEIPRLKKAIAILIKAETDAIIQRHQQIEAFFSRYASGVSRRQAPWDIFAGILSIGSTIFTLHQVSGVKQDMEVVRSEEIAQAREMLDLKKGLLKLTLHLKTMEVYQHVYKNVVPKIRTAALYLGKIVDGLHDAVKLELNTDLIDEHTLITEIMKDIKALGYSPVSAGIDLLYKSFLTAEINEQALYVTVHVPIVRYLESILTLKRILPIYAVDENLTFLKFAPKHEYIAVSKNRLAHIPITADELLSCVQKDRFFYCPDMTILYRKAQSCAAALYYNNVVSYLEMCDFIFTKTPEEASRVGLHEYLVKDSGKDARSREYCTNNLSPKNVRSSVGIYTLDEDCRLEHPDYLIIPEKDINRHQEFYVKINISMEMLNLSDFDYSQIVKTLETQREIPRTLKESATHTAVSILIIIVSVLSAVLVLLCVGLGCFFKKFGHFFFGLEDVSIHDQDEEKEHEHRSSHVVEKVATAAQLAATAL